jgi:hypothetical protein
MKKIVRLTESQLKDLINKVIVEQDLALGQNYQKGLQTGTAAGQIARQVVNKATASAANLGKEVVITIGKTVLTIVVGAGYAIFLIGKGIYKVTQSIGNAIIKFLSSTGRATIKTANKLGSVALSGLQSAGVSINKGLDAIKQQINSIKDSSMAVVKWVIGLFKSMGVVIWAKILVSASQIKEFGQEINGWLKQQWSSIQNQVGVTWDKASSWATGAINKAASTVKQGVSTAANAVKQGVSTAANAIKQGATNYTNKVSNVAGNTWGAIQGFLNEMFERLLSFKGTTTDQILSEAVKFNGKSIL